MKKTAYLNFIKESLILPVKQQVYLPQMLNFFVTSRCNARCDFCLYNEQVNNPVAKNRELTIEQIIRFAQNYGNLHYLGLSGGEPFVRNDIAEIGQAFTDFCNLKILDIPSNFYYTETMLESVQKLVTKNPHLMVELQFSVDNIGEKHNESRKVKGLYAKAIETFKLLQKIRKTHQNLKLKINILYLPNNKDNIDEICKELSKQIIFDRIQLTFPHQLINENSTLITVPEIEAYIAKAEEIDAKFSFNSQVDIHSIGLRALKKTYHKLLKKSVTGELNTGAYCEAGKHIIIVNELGDVFPCEPLWDQKMGNIVEYNYNMKELINNQRYKSFRKKFLGKDKCNCTFSCAINSEISSRFKYFPELAMNAGKIYSRTL